MSIDFVSELYFSNYLILFILFFCVIMVSTVILGIVFFFNFRYWYDSSLHSIYECGFLPFEEARIRFESRFYMVALSFIIFDLEICFIFPWLITFTSQPLFAFLFFLLFLILLTFGIVYEWQVGIFDWFNLN